jgi:hypothetical protein
MIWQMGRGQNALQVMTWLKAVEVGKDVGCRAGSIQGRRIMSTSGANRAHKDARSSKGGQFKPLRYRYSRSVS